MLKLVEQGAVPSVVFEVCEGVNLAGGRAWLVGGSVRDLLLKEIPEDWDIEVYGLGCATLNELLKKFGPCGQVGKHFGVIKLWVKGLEIDVALPRTERKVGLGHKGFDVSVDPYLSPEVATLRRDFTINAMMFDPLTGELLDLHGGIGDLKEKRLHHVSPSFIEDPLRPLRAMQLAARFQLTLSDDLKKICGVLLVEAGSLPGPRIWQEWLKWCKSAYPSYGMEALKGMGWLALYPGLEALVGCPQNERWHPEGDVWVHTCNVVDESARLVQERGLAADEGVALLLAALCHDIGKPKVTCVDDELGVCAPMHEQAGLGIAREFIKLISAPKSIENKVLPLVKEHGMHFSTELTGSAVSWLSYRLKPVNIKLWEVLAEADACGCPPLPKIRPALSWLEAATLRGVALGVAKPIVTGKFLIAWGMGPSKAMGKVIDDAYVSQLNEEFYDEASARSWLKEYDIASGGK